MYDNVKNNFITKWYQYFLYSFTSPGRRMFNILDHVAIVVNDIDRSLLIWKEKFGLKISADEIVANGGIRLLHLDVENMQIQLLQPLDDRHPIAEWLKQHGEGLHHLCFYVDDFDTAINFAKATGLVKPEVMPHDGPHKKRAIFLDTDKSMGVRIELTGN